MIYWLLMSAFLKDPIPFDNVVQCEAAARNLTASTGVTHRCVPIVKGE